MLFCCEMPELEGSGTDQSLQFVVLYAIALNDSSIFIRVMNKNGATAVCTGARPLAGLLGGYGAPLYTYGGIIAKGE